jgi:hypothetical protein
MSDMHISYLSRIIDRSNGPIFAVNHVHLSYIVRNIVGEYNS